MPVCASGARDRAPTSLMVTGSVPPPSTTREASAAAEAAVAEVAATSVILAEKPGRRLVKASTEPTISSRAEGGHPVVTWTAFSDLICSSSSVPVFKWSPSRNRFPNCATSWGCCRRPPMPICPSPRTGIGHEASGASFASKCTAFTSGELAVVAQARGPVACKARGMMGGRVPAVVAATPVWEETTPSPPPPPPPSLSPP
jgi:hypothetical protein